MMIYLTGMYVTLVLLVLMGEYGKFRDYYADELSHLTNMLKLNIDSYTFMIPGTVMISIFSWIGVLYTIFMIIDCYNDKVVKDKK